MLSRREMLKVGLAAAGTTLLPIHKLHAAPWLLRRRIGDDPVSPPVVPFVKNLPIPRVLEPVASLPGGVRCDMPPGLPDPLLYRMQIKTGRREIIPGLETEFWGYNGQFPGPTIKVRRNQPIVVRFKNNLDRSGIFTENVVHHHGGHNPADSDGFPNHFIHPGESRDYCYPNIAPDDEDADFQSTTWYHDHAEDLTGENVYMGLAGFYIMVDDLEENLVDTGKLPAEPYDVPLVIQDRVFGRDGELLYDPLDHDGVLGDRFLVNGEIQPKLKVERRKYRFRILNGSNARIYELRFGNDIPFLAVGTDSWLLDKARELRSIVLAPAERLEVVIDFRNAPSEVFLENILEQTDGRKPDDRVKPGFPLMKFEVQGGPPPEDPCTTRPGTLLRPNIRIARTEIVKRRHFKFTRNGGAWTINGELYDPDRDDARPELGTAEEWILETSGGWAHPIHMHLEGFQIQRYDGKRPARHLLAKKDTVYLAPGVEAKVRMKFRTFPGRFVFHCHNVEHEDMRMMGVMNVRA